jgi:hypothetical protein
MELLMKRSLRYSVLAAAVLGYAGRHNPGIETLGVIAAVPLR